ncbi:hypothetical protein ACFPN4_13720 [Ureibacillus thermophilus]|uniref:hypothetical protein n=1 Tax=Ureibacillus thermophilus TaxID=367743 RepID=UPI00360A3B69
MDKVLSYGWKIFWIIGLFILTIISFDLKHQIEEGINYRIEGYLWYIFFMHFIWGIYFSLICIKKWKFQFNFPLFICVFLPCLIFSLIVPVASITTHTLPFGQWFLKIYSSGLVEMAAGFTLMISIFYGTNKRNGHNFA